MIRLSGCFSVRIFTCLFIFTLCGRINGNERVDVKEGSDAILPCSLSTKENIEFKLFDWKKDDKKEVFLYDAGLHYNNGRDGQDKQFKGRVSHFPDQLKNGDASIKIQNTKLADSGNYTCDFPHLQPSQTFHIELVVGAASVPYVKTVKTNDGVLLQCEVLGVSPKTKVEWKDSSGNIVPAEEPKITERGGSYDIILQTTVTKTDHYWCIVTQEEIYHQTENDIYVTHEKPEKIIQGDLTGWIVAVSVLSILLLLVLVVGGVLFFKGIIKVSPIKCRQWHENDFEEPSMCDRNY